MKLVDARGNAVTVNSTHNADLWWAMRGVGSGYIGIVTGIKLKMFKAKDLRLTFTQIRYRVKDFQDVIGNYTQWLDWVRENEPSVMSVINVVNDNFSSPNFPVWPGIELHLLHIQDPNAQPNSNEGFLEAFPKFFTNAVETITRNPSFIEFAIGTGYTPVVRPKLQVPQNSSSAQLPATQTVTNVIDNTLDFYSTLTKDMAIPRYFFSKSFFVNKHFRSEQLADVQNIVNEIPNNTNGIQINSEQGAVAGRRSSDSAYSHRNSLFNVRLFVDSVQVDSVAAGKNWTRQFMKVAQFMDAGETYQNYPDLELDDYLVRFYGSNLYKLIQIKQRWDPFGYFNSKMSIPRTLFVGRRDLLLG